MPVVNKKATGERVRRLKKFAQELDKKHTELLRNFGEQWYAESQKLVPVVTGQLKDSAIFKKDTRGAKLMYTAPYAYGVHGGEHERLMENWVSPIPKHKRKLPSGKVIWVRKHTKTYKEGFKPIKGSDTSGKGMGWYAKDVHQSGKGHGWMEKAFENVLRTYSKEDRKLLPKKVRIGQGFQFSKD